MLARPARFLQLIAALLSLVLLNGCSCSSNTCGDGTTDDIEQCDDGNTVSGDGCSAQCRREGDVPTCGDGNVDPGEQCDDGNTTGGDGCSAACETETSPTCGDNNVDPGEQCDDGNTADGDGCSSTCQTEAPPSCGDGNVDPGEACDDGNSVNGDGCENDCTVTPLIEILCEDLQPLPTGTCEVTPGDASKLIVGVVLTPGIIYHGGRVAVDAQGMISCVGCDCDAPAATRITCPRGVVSPGLINSHDHITFTQSPPYTATDERYEHRHDWRRGNNGHTQINSSGGASANQIRWGELRFLMGGATSTVGSGSATGILRNLDRAEQEGLGQPQVSFDTFPLGDSNGVEYDVNCFYPAMVTEADIDGIDAYFPHVAEGIEASARNELLCLHTNPNDIMQPQSAFIHAIGLRAGDYAAMAANGTALIWSPRSNITLYGDTAVVTAAARLGVQIALGTDWLPSGSMNLLRELHCADSLNTTYYAGFFSDEDLWMMVTARAAMATATDDVLGVLAQGKVGDISIFDGSVHPKHRAVIDAEPQDVTLVLRSGKALYGDAALVSALSTGGACDTIADVCGVQKQVCLVDDIGMSYPALQTAVGATIYGNFFCGDPPNEPSCTPSRTATAPVNASVHGSTIYTGQPTANDTDGDGIDNAMDNCASVFNPIRPVDEGTQADYDNDGVGDACDECPLDPGTSLCVAPIADDFDNDAVLDAVDNCVSSPNAAQTDTDMDGKGDACDPCPTEANPANAGCTMTIYEIKNGMVPRGAIVNVDNAIVTGRFPQGFFLQVKAGDPDYMGPEYSGVFVYTGVDTGVSVGDRVTLSDARVQDYFGQIQLTFGTVTINQSQGEATPDPVVALPSDVATDGMLAGPLEGVLVEVQDVDVTAPPDSFNEFVVAGALRVDDLLYLITPAPVVSDNFAAIRGVLNLRNSDSKLEPRGPADVVAGPPKLSAFGPPLSYANLGQVASPTFPTPLTVTLTGAPMVATFVTVTSPDPAVVVTGGGVTVPAGSTSAVVLVDGIAVSPGVTLTATLDTISLTADVSVVDPAQLPIVQSLTPSPLTVPPGGTGTFTVTLDIPAPAGGTVVDLALAPANAGTIPVTVTVLAGQLSATFDYVDGSVVQSATVTATLGASMATADINVVAGGGHLVINEIDYDQINTDATEFIEIYNGTGAPVDLAGYSLRLLNGNGNAQYGDIPLDQAGTLNAGQYLVVGSTMVTAPPAALKIDFPLMVCNTQTNCVQNGAPDGVALVDTTTCALVDALSYEGGMTAAVLSAPCAGTVSLVEGTALPAAVADSNTDVRSLCRLPDGTDTDNAATDWASTLTPTPGAPNVP